MYMYDRYVEVPGRRALFCCVFQLCISILPGTATYTHTYTYKVHNLTMRMWNVFPNVSVSLVTGPRPAVFVD